MGLLTVTSASQVSSLVPRSAETRAFSSCGRSSMNDGGHVAGDEVGIVQHGLQEGDVGGDAADAELGQGAAGAGHGGRVVAAAAGQLDQHRVEVRADLGAGVDGAAVEPDTGAAGGTVAGDLADVGPEAVGRVLGGDAALQGGALELDRLLGEAQVREGLAGGDAQLRLHEVDVGDFLGDGVLDLDARVHFDEDVLAGALPHGVDQELDGAGVDVVQGLGELHGVAVERLADAFVQVRRRGDLDDLLVAALDGAVTLEEVHDVALGVGQDLHLDVAGAQHGLLEEHRGVTEGGVGFAHGGLQGLGQGLPGVDAAHAAAAAAGDGLGEDGEADLVGGGDEFIEVLGRLAGLQDGDAGLAGGLQGGDLVAGQFQHLGGRAHEGDAGRRGGAGQVAGSRRGSRSRGRWRRRRTSLATRTTSSTSR